jgi:hypothetical protein
MTITLGDPPKLLERLTTLRNDPLEFFKTSVLTLDQADRRTPIKAFPWQLPYIPPILDKLLSERLLAIRKTRRMIMSWAIMTFNLWDAMFHIGRSIYVQSDKEEKSDELIRRAKFIYDNLPPYTKPVVPKAVYKYKQLLFPEIDSVIIGVPQGRDQLRQITASRIFGDEFGFWDEAEASYGSMRPTIEGGGQIVLVSSSFPGFFKRIVEDDIV